MADKGVGWAKKWVSENHGQSVKSLPTYRKKK